MRAGAGLLLVASTACAALHAQQPRDGGPPPTGTASISGVVVTADMVPMPVRRATVELNGVALLTDDDGRYSFTKLIPSTYFVVANKPGYLPGAFGAKRGAGPGVGIEVRAGQQVRDVRLRLFRGSVLAGVVMDQLSRPAADTVVRAFRDGIDASTGERLPLPVSIGLGETITDDKGQYRFYGLEPGDYVVSAGGPPAVASVRLTTGEDLRYARQLLQIPAGMPIDTSIRRPSAVASPRRGEGVPMYYPSAESVAEATRIALGAAEERLGVDVVRRSAGAGIVKGNVAGPFATIREGGKVHIVDTASPYSTLLPWDKLYGSFVFTGVPPGRYEVVAIADSGGLLARAEVFVIPSSEAALALFLRPGATVTGRLVFEGTSAQPADPAFVRLSLSGVGRADIPISTSPARADGRFTWTGLPTGNYRLSVSTTGNLQPGWRAKSAMLNGVELLDGVFDTATAGAGEIVVTLTDARSRISGTLQSPDGAPVSDYSVLVFSADIEFWKPASRRTLIVRPNSNGVFALMDLPEGDYLIVALADIQAGQWHNPAFLAELAPFAIKVSLADGEKKTQNIRISGGTR